MAKGISAWLIWTTQWALYPDSACPPLPQSCMCGWSGGPLPFCTLMTSFVPRPTHRHSLQLDLHSDLPSLKFKKPLGSFLTFHCSSLSPSWYWIHPVVLECWIRSLLRSSWAEVDLTKSYILLGTGSVLFPVSQGQRLQSCAMRLCLRRCLQKVVGVK